MQVMSDEEAAAKLLELEIKFDTEMSHFNADEFITNLLYALGYVKTAETFDGMRKWYA